MEMHKFYIKRCLQLASCGLPFAMPNPSVGAVLVYKDVIIGEGYTSPFGGSHGEVNCINSVLEENQKYISNSTLYVSLEPCSHTGKTPPCANLIVARKIPKVVIGCVDTFSLVAGNGIKILQKNGVEVISGVMEKECRMSNTRFFTFHEKKRPYVILKWAETTDNFIAPPSEFHEKERWITGSESGILVHKMRANEMGIIVGTNTVLVDDPNLTTRNYYGGNPIRIILDKNLKLWNKKEEYAVFNKQASTFLINGMKNFEQDNVQGIKIDFNKNVVSQLLTKLYESNIQSLIVEGGKATLESFIEKRFWDEAVIFTGNKKFSKGLKAPKFEFLPQEEFKIGEDILRKYINKI